MLNKNSKNPEVAEAFADQLATGVPVVFAIDKTKNDEYVTLCIAQEIETPGSATAEQELFLGWGSNKSVVRYLQNVNVKQFSVLEQKWGKIQPGTVLTGTSVQVTESNEAGSHIGENGERVYQEPKVYPATSKNAGKRQLDAENGKPIYRNTSLVLTLTPRHTFIKGVPEGSTEALAAEVQSTFKELATA